MKRFTCFVMEIKYLKNDGEKKNKSRPCKKFAHYYMFFVVVVLFCFYKNVLASSFSCMGRGYVP